jgi:uncharacterized protein with HEPN domain
MSKREVKLYLSDIDDAVSAIQSYTRDMTYEQLLADRKTREAIILNFVVIGEAIKKIPQEIINRHPECSLEGVCRHAGQDGAGYFMISPSIFWGNKPARSRSACGCGDGAAQRVCVKGVRGPAGGWGGSPADPAPLWFPGTTPTHHESLRKSTPTPEYYRRSAGPTAAENGVLLNNG